MAKKSAKKKSAPKKKATKKKPVAKPRSAKKAKKAPEKFGFSFGPGIGEKKTPEPKKTVPPEPKVTKKKVQEKSHNEQIHDLDYDDLPPRLQNAFTKQEWKQHLNK